MTLQDITAQFEAQSGNFPSIGKSIKFQMAFLNGKKIPLILSRLKSHHLMKVPFLSI